MDLALAQRLVQTVLARGGQLPAASLRSLVDLACRCAWLPFGAPVPECLGCLSSELY